MTFAMGLSICSVFSLSFTQQISELPQNSFLKGSELWVMCIYSRELWSVSNSSWGRVVFWTPVDVALSRETFLLGGYLAVYITGRPVVWYFLSGEIMNNLLTLGFWNEAICSFDHWFSSFSNSKLRSPLLASLQRATFYLMFGLLQINPDDIMWSKLASTFKGLKHLCLKDSPRVNHLYRAFSAFSCGMEPCCSECGILLLNALAVHISQLVAQFWRLSCLELE